MKVRSHNLNPFAARGIAIIFAAVFVNSPHTARAGIHNQDAVITATQTSTVTAAIPFTPTITPTPSITPTPTVTPTPTSTVTGTPPTPTPTTPAVENVWISHGPGVIPVTALAVDPGTLYAATAGYGAAVFKSTDAGATWRVASAANFLADALVLDSSTPGTLYAGEAGSCDQDSRVCLVGVVLKSTNGGETWQTVSAGLSDEGAVVALAVDPTTARTLYAGTSQLCTYGENGPCAGGACSRARTVPGAGGR